MSTETNFTNTSDGVLEILNSMFGIAPIHYNGSNQLTMTDTPIAGTGSIINTSPGKYSGTLYYEDLEDLSHKRYLLNCVVEDNQLKVLFIQPETSITKGMFVSGMTERNRQFDGIIQFG